MAKEKAVIINTVTGEHIPVMFNPEQYSFSKSNNFSEIGIPGLESPLVQYVMGGAQKLTLDLFFDTYEKKEDVRGYTNKITDLMKINKGTKAPPVCIFSWGSVTFTCVIESITKKFEMFLPTGIPVRARLTVGLKEYKQAASQYFESPAPSRNVLKKHTVTAGDSMQSIAAKEYGDVRQWRKIAKANKVINPRILTPGKTFNIPKI